MRNYATKLLPRRDILKFAGAASVGAATPPIRMSRAEPVATARAITYLPMALVKFGDLDFHHVSEFQYRSVITGGSNNGDVVRSTYVSIDGLVRCPRRDWIIDAIESPDARLSLYPPYVEGSRRIRHAVVRPIKYQVSETPEENPTGRAGETAWKVSLLATVGGL